MSGAAAAAWPIEMGRYGAYVWPAYGISAAVILALAAWTLLRSAAWRRRAERAEAARAEARSRTAPPPAA